VDAEVRIVPDIFSEACGTRTVLNLLANKWTVLVMAALFQGVQRYGQLQRQIEGISPKMLTQTLRALERDGLITRKVYPVVPPMVEYTPTPLGDTLLEPLSALCQWAALHLSEVEAARERPQVDGEQTGSTAS
jgi:DNA-binding HxlR family transcriptional regulator